MSKSNVFEQDLLNHIFNNSNISAIGDATGLRGSTVAGSFYVGLHTGDPGEAASQDTSETAYTGYNRIAVARSGAGFVVTGNSVSPAAPVSFDECAGSPGGDITHFTIGTDATGSGYVLYKGAVTPNIPMSVGAVPTLKTTSTITED